MAEPQNAQEYLERFAENQRIEGFGIGNVYISMPCPFCAAPEFMKYELLDTEKAMEAGGQCKACARGARAILVRHQGGVEFELVQTNGPDQPHWLTPKMRRDIG